MFLYQFSTEKYLISSFFMSLFSGLYILLRKGQIEKGTYAYISAEWKNGLIYESRDKNG